MGELKMFPMTYVSFTKKDRTVGLVFANSSKRIISTIGDLPDSWMHTDAELATTRLVSAGWKEVSRRKVDA